MKKYITFILLILFTFFSIKINAKAVTTYEVSNDEEFYNKIEEIHSTSNETYIIKLTDDIVIDSETVVKNNTTIDNGNNVTIVGGGYSYKITVANKGRLTVSGATLNLGLADESDELTIAGAGDGVAAQSSLITVNNGTVNMYKGVTLKDNKSGSYAIDGGAVRLSTNGVFNMYNGVITNNSSETSGAGGGAIMLDDIGSEFNMYDGEISYNYAGSWGGAILSYLYGTVNIEGGKFIGNEGVYGGAIATLDKTVTIENAIFDDNKSSYGGALLSYNYYGGASFVISDSVFMNNSADNGGAILAWGSSITVSDSIVKMNSATIGGGVYLASGECDLETTSVYNNKATNNGNDYYIASDVTSIKIIKASDMDGYAIYDDKNYNLLNWYNDSSTDRYDPTSPTSVVNLSSITAGNEYSLAAGGERVYVLKFESNGGTEIEDQVINVGNKGVKPTNPTKIGTSFTNWYSNEELTELFNFNEVLTDDVTLYAKWEDLVYNFITEADQVFIKGNNKNGSFEVDADSSLFGTGLKVYVDDELISDSNYTIEEGTSIINLKSDFLNTLDVGKHTLKVKLDDGGIAITTFIIKTEGSTNPPTGDNLIKYLFLSLIGIVLLLRIVFKNKIMEK